MCIKKIINKKNSIILCLFLCLTCYANQTVVYEWKDSKGELHFSDKPHQGAKKIRIKMPQTYKAESIPLIKETTTINKTPTKVNVNNYSLLEILTPSAGSTLKNNTGMVDVMVNVKPKLHDGDKIQLSYDGQSFGLGQKDSVFNLTNVYRGSHTIKIRIINKDGNVLKTSKTITFYMQRILINQNNNLNNSNIIRQQGPQIRRAPTKVIQRVVP